MKKYLSLSIASILALGAANVVEAQLYVTAQPGGVPSVSGATLETFDESSPPILTLSGTAVLTTGAGTLDGGLVFPPYFSGSTAAYFGEPVMNINGYPNFDGSQFVAVATGGSATLSFPTPQNYLGLLWGTIDTGNTLTFYDSANNIIGTVVGENLPGTTLSGNPTDPGENLYVNVTSTTPFSRVVATYNGASFEFDDVAYAVVVPEPASIVLFGAGLCCLGLAWRRKLA